MPCSDEYRLSVEYLKNVFDNIDHEKKGWVDSKNLSSTLQELGLAVSFTQVNHLFQSMDADCNARVNFSEFCSFIRLREDELYDIFTAVKPDNEGRITTSQLAEALIRCLRISKDIKDTLKTTQEFVEFVASIDKHGEKTFTFKDFMRVIMLMPEVDVKSVFKYWSKSFYIDLGEDYLVPDEPTVQKSRLNIFLSGAIGGCLSRTVTAPLDRLKVVMQAGKGDGRIWSSLMYLYREGGLLGLWRGNGINCVKIAPESAIKFLCYGEIKRHVAKVTGGNQDDLSIAEKFFAGASAGLVSQTVVYPLEIVKTRLALSVTGEFKSVPDVFVTILREGGVRGMYRGLTPSLLGIVPYAGIDLMVFNTLKEKWVAAQRRQRVLHQMTMSAENRAEHWPITPDVPTLLAFGAVSSTLGQLVAYPLQLVRTRMQADKVGELRRYKSMLDCFLHTVRTDGYIGLYRGIGPNVLKNVPSISISYAVFETVSGKLQKWI